MAEEKLNKVKDIIVEISPYYQGKIKKGLGEEVPPEEHNINYNSSSETLEPLYFWTVDKMNEFFGGKVEKLRDDFVSTPGSGHFSELMGKASRMHEEVNKIMQTVGILIKSIINIIYDLKEFEIRLSQYKAARSKNKEEAEAGLLGLKQIWMDNVDMKRGQGSINALTTGNLNFVTLRDAFMAAKSVEDVENMDLNDRVKRILKPRLQEFFKWKELSERELRKRYEIEKTYLRNQLNSLKLNTRWARPFLRASLDLEQVEKTKSPDLVKAFNTIRLELTLLGKKSFDFREAVLKREGGLPPGLRKLADMSPEKRKNKIREYYSCVLVDFVFRGIPQKVGQHYVFGGRSDIWFRAYALNDEEIEMINKKLEDADFKEVTKIVTGMTEDSLKQLEEDIKYFLNEEEKREELDESEEKKKDINPFAALLGFGNEKENIEKKKEEIETIKSDNYIESLIREMTEQTAKSQCFSLFDIFKKNMGMASHPDPYE